MTVVLALVILRLIEVQANDSPPTPFSSPFSVENIYKTFSSALKERLKVVRPLQKRITRKSRQLVYLIVLEVASKQSTHITQCFKKLQMPKYYAEKLLVNIVVITGLLNFEIVYLNGTKKNSKRKRTDGRDAFIR